MMINVSEIKLLQKSKQLTVTFDNGEQATFPCLFLRLNSPSSEAKAENKALVAHSAKDVNIIGIDPVGNYGVKLIFDDGHDTGIFSWQTFYELAQRLPK